MAFQTLRRIAIGLGLVCCTLILNAQNPWDYKGRPNWDNSWNKRPMPRIGTCFFKDGGFQGDRFCVVRGDKLDSLPGNFGDNISSLQLFGGAKVMVFNDREFRGGSQEFRSSIRDLRTQKFRDGHTWNDRISSIIVR